MANTVKVRVRCVVDIPVGSWDGDCDLASLSDTAKKEGLQSLQKIMRKNDGAVYGEPKVVFVMCEEQ